MIIQITNLPDGSQIFMQISEEQWDLINRFKDLGIIVTEVNVEEIEIEDMV